MNRLTWFTTECKRVTEAGYSVVKVSIFCKGFLLSGSRVRHIVGSGELQRLPQQLLPRRVDHERHQLFHEFPRRIRGFFSARIYGSLAAQRRHQRSHHSRWVRMSRGWSRGDCVCVQESASCSWFILKRWRRSTARFSFRFSFSWWLSRSVWTARWVSE